MVGDSLLFANGDTAASPSRLTVNRESMFIGERGNQGAPLTQISRQYEAGVDLNGDGDGVDGFVVITVEGGAPQRHFSPGSCQRRVNVNLALYCRSEVSGDLNGDGDLTDQQVMRVLVGGSIEPTGVFLSSAVSVLPVEISDLPDGRYAWADTIFTADGTQTIPIAGFTVVGMSSGSPVVCPSGTYGGCKLIPSSGQPVDVGSSLPTWTQVGTVFWITESELRLGDLNGDGDLLDEQLCRLSAAGASTSCLDVRPRSSSQYPIISTGEDRGLVLGFSPSASPLHRLFYAGPATSTLVDLGSSGGFVDRFEGGGALATVHANTPGQTASYVTKFISRDGVITDVLHSQQIPAVMSTGPNEALLAVTESLGFDYNGDGDWLDRVSFIVTSGPAGGRMTRMQFPPILENNYGYPSVRAIGAGATVVVFAEPGVDLNGDGDTLDRVYHGVNPDGTVVNLRYASGPAVPTGARHAAIEPIAPGIAAVAVDEASQGTDMNSDGDLLDVVAVRVVAPDFPNFAVVSPDRLLDTRLKTQAGYSGAKPDAGQTVTLQVTGRAGVPTSGVTAVAMNVTITEATAPGFVTVWPGGERPTTSNLNVEYSGQTVPNLVIVPVGPDGKIRLFTQSGGHLIADIAAWFGPASPLTTQSPRRILDTRPDTAIAYTGTKPGVGQTVVLPIPASTAPPGSMVVMNVTATEATGAGFVTVWGDGNRPNASNLNIERAGQTIPNLVITPVGVDGNVRLFTQRGTHLIADLAVRLG